MKENKNCILWLSSLRGLACLIVVFAHIIAFGDNIGIYASGCGKIGVWFFMLISAILLYRPYFCCEREINPKSLIDFYGKRVLKIYPSYAVVLLLAYFIGVITDFTDVFKHIFLIEGMWHFWYIPVIVKFYLVVPVFIVALSFLKRTKEKVVLITTMGICFSIGFPFTHYVENATSLFWYIPVFMMGFITLIIMEQIQEKIKEHIIFDIIIFIDVLIMLAFTPLFRKLIWNIEPSGYLQNKYLLYGLLWSLLIVAIFKSKYCKYILEKQKWLLWVGKISYPLYLIHYIILYLLKQKVPNFLLRLGITLVISIIIAWGIHALIEVPISKIKNNKIGVVFVGFFVMIIFFVIGGVDLKNSINNNGTKDKTWQERLYVPTMIQKINTEYFIVDCWHHRVIYNTNLDKNLDTWNTLTDEDYIGGHTICSDGELYVLDNTDNSQVLVYGRKEDGTFEKLQTIPEINGRPHYVVYDESRKQFYIIASTEGKIYSFKNENGCLKLMYVYSLPEIENSYVRSISIIDGSLYTVSGKKMICKYGIKDTGFELEQTYPVPDAFYGMNQIIKIQDYYYITVNTNGNGDVSATTIFRVKNLEDINEGKYEILYDTMGFVGQPYFITAFDNGYYITEISETRGNGIKRFGIENNQVKNVENIFYWEDVQDFSIERYHSKYQESDNSEAQDVDLYIFCGQSNMSGKGDASKAPVVGHGWEFRAVTDPTTLYPIQEPFGLNENNSNGVNDSWPDTGELRKSGGLVSSFANSYYQNTGVPIVGVSCSEGATTIDGWLPGTARYNDIVSRCGLGKTYLQNNEKYQLRHTYMVWCQGESDGDNGVSSETYYQELDQLVTSLIADEIVEKCMLIRSGKNGNDLKKYDNIIDAQTRYCRDNENCILISTSFSEFATKGLMKDQYHYEQEGYNLVGEEAGRYAAMYVNSGREQIWLH